MKKEFDECRAVQLAHRLFKESGLAHLVPFRHPNLDRWRDSLHHGLQARYKNTNIILTGGIDDIWQDMNDKKLIVVDYKSQANSKPLTPESYLEDPFHQGYKVQLDFYAFLLREMNFEVSKTGYFLVCNADRGADGFFGKMDFSETLIPYEWDASWIPDKVSQMIDLINQADVPDGNPSCNNCAYARQRAAFESVANSLM